MHLPITADFTVGLAQATIVAGSLTGMCVIPITNDFLVEDDERFGLTLSLPGNSPAQLGGGSTATGVIQSEDSQFNSCQLYHLLCLVAFLCLYSPRPNYPV